MIEGLVVRYDSHVRRQQLGACERRTRRDVKGPQGLRLGKRADIHEGVRAVQNDGVQFMKARDPVQRVTGIQAQP